MQRRKNRRLDESEGDIVRQFGEMRKVKIKVTLVAYRTVTIEVDADSEDDIDAFKLKQDAIAKARTMSVSPTWDLENWEIEPTESV